MYRDTRRETHLETMWKWVLPEQDTRYPSQGRNDGGKGAQCSRRRAGLSEREAPDKVVTARLL